MSKIYSIDQVEEIISEQEWIVTTCNNEPSYGVTTLQCQHDEDTDYFGEFIGNDYIGYMFIFYTK